MRLPSIHIYSMILQKSYVYFKLLLHYRKKEEEARRRLLENPIRMKQLQKAVSIYEEEWSPCQSSNLKNVHVAYLCC